MLAVWIKPFMSSTFSYGSVSHFFYKLNLIIFILVYSSLLLSLTKSIIYQNLFNLDDTLSRKLRGDNSDEHWLFEFYSVVMKD